MAARTGLDVQNRAGQRGSRNQRLEAEAERVAVDARQLPESETYLAYPAAGARVGGGAEGVHDGAGDS